MSTPAKILVVDDTPQNVKLLADLLAVKGYAVVTAADGAQALEKLAAETPDLVLLDVMMPGLNGYQVCERIREDARTALLPVVLVTALDPHQERVKGIEAGADDFLSKPISQQELFARVKSLLRIKRLQDEVKEWNAKLETRVREQVAQLERLGRLKRFFSPQIAEAVIAGGEEALRAHRREVTVVFLDLRGFTAFNERAAPEEVMALLGEYHGAVGRLVMAHGGTLERFAGDSIMVFFNDPVPMERPAEQAVRMALAARDAFARIGAGWAKRGYELALGAGVAQGYATLGAIGYEGRWDYAAIGSVTNLAARLCAEATGGRILACQKTMASVEDVVEAEPLAPLALRGFSQPVSAFALTRLKPGSDPRQRKIGV
jgi:class 3 adenylate cyclase/CheY-like chemotaxis protein